MSAGYRFKRDDALPHAWALVQILRPTCAQIEIAGSLRRGKATVGDIEIVARPLVEERPVAGQLGLFGDGQPATIERVSLLDPVLDGLAATGGWSTGARARTPRRPPSGRTSRCWVCPGSSRQTAARKRFKRS
jgi:hypothetical protein